MALSYQLKKVTELTEPMKVTMFGLFRQYYYDVEWNRFVADLTEKTDVILMFDEHDPVHPYLFGFSTVLKTRTQDRGFILYSGDTVVDSNYWGSRLLQAGFSKILWKTRISHPFSPLYWMLISKGYKTYMLMRRNFPRSVPSFNRPSDTELNRVKDEFYKKKFPGFYSPESSLIDFGESLGRVKDEIAVPTQKALTNPDVKFFIERNPRYSEGVEFACIAKIRWLDLMNIAFKYLFSARVKAHTSIELPEKTAEKTI